MHEVGPESGTPPQFRRRTQSDICPQLTNHKWVKWRAWRDLNPRPAGLECGREVEPGKKGHIVPTHVGVDRLLGRIGGGPNQGNYGGTERVVPTHVRVDQAARAELLGYLVVENVWPTM